MTRETTFAARSAYALSALLVILPMADITLGFFPLQFDNLRWRIGVTGMTTGALLLPVTGMILALVTAHLKGDRGVQNGLAGLLTIGGMILFAVAVMFTLDTVQMRGEIDVRGRHLYDRAALKGIISQLLTAGILLFIGISSLRTTRAYSRQGKQRAAEASPLIGRSNVPTGAKTTD